jgi:hypothetical protein
MEENTKARNPNEQAVIPANRHDGREMMAG